MNTIELRAHYVSQGLSEDEAHNAISEIAAHEAGHFVMAAMIGQCPKMVDIVPTAERAGVCGGVPWYPAYVFSGQQLQELMLTASNGRQMVESFVCANIVHMLAGGFGTYWTHEDYDYLGVDADRREAYDMAAKVFSNPETVLIAMDSVCGRAMFYRRVGAAIIDIAQWLTEHVQPSDDDIELKYFDTVRRIGFMRKRIQAWISIELDKMAQVSAVCELVDESGEPVYK